MLLTVGSVYGRTVGSNNLVARQKEAYFKAGASNQLLGFSVFEGGLIFESSNTKSDIDVFFPLSGNVVLNGGTLTLKKDLVFQSPFYLGSGIINGDFYAIEFPHNVSRLQVPCAQHKDILSLVDQIDSVTDINSVDWSFDNQYVAVGIDGTNSSDELHIYYFDGEVLTYTASYDFSKKSVYSVRWHPSDYYLAVGKTSNDELNIFHLDVPSGVLSLTDSANVSTVHAVAWHPDGAHLAVGQSSSNVLVYPVSSGILGSSSSVSFGSSRTVARNALDWSSNGSYLAAGLYKKSGSDDVYVYSFDGTDLTFNASSQIGQNIYAVSWHPSGASLAIGAASGNERLRLYDHDSQSGSLNEVTSARVNEVKAVYGLSWNSAGTLLASSRASDSNGFDVKIFSYDSKLKTLNVSTGFETGQTTECVRWASGDMYVASGDRGDTLRVYKLVEAPLTFKDVKLFFGSDVAITTTVRFEGECTINASNHNIDITDGMLVIADDAQLQIEHAIVRGIQDNKIHCTNDSSVLSLRDVSWIFDGDTTFSTGALQFKNSVAFVGDAIFAYQSHQTSTVCTKSEFELDAGMTFSYDPIIIADKDLFAFESSSSVLSLNGATLHTTVTGMNLEGGKLSIKRDSYLTAETEDQEDHTVNVGFTFGNNSALHDMKIDIYGSQTLFLTSGKLSYKNIDSSALHFGNLNSSLYIHPETRLYMYQNIDLNPGYLTLGGYAVLGKTTGRSIVGSIRPEGKYFNIGIPS